MDADGNDGNGTKSFLCFHGDSLTVEYHAAMILEEFFDYYRGHWNDFNHFMDCDGNPGDKASFIAGYFCALQVMFGFPFTMLQICDFPDPVLSPTSTMSIESGEVVVDVAAGAPCQSFSHILNMAFPGGGIPDFLQVDQVGRDGRDDRAEAASSDGTPSPSCTPSSLPRPSESPPSPGVGGQGL